MVAHPRSASGGLCFIFKFRLDRIYSFGDRSIFTFWHFGLKLPLHAHFYGALGHISPNDVIYSCNSQKAHPCVETRRLSHKAWKSVQRFDLGRVAFKDRSRPVASAASVIGWETRPVLILATGLGFATQPCRARARDRRTGQDSQKVTKAFYVTWVKAPTEPILTKICTVVGVSDISRGQTFELKFSGVTILQGVEFHVFLLILAWALQQCSATAVLLI